MQNGRSLCGCTENDRQRSWHDRLYFWISNCSASQPLVSHTLTDLALLLAFTHHCIVDILSFLPLLFLRSLSQIVSDSLDRLQTTASSHERVLVVEIMGRNAGWMTADGGLAGGAHWIFIPGLMIGSLLTCLAVSASSSCCSLLSLCLPRGLKPRLPRVAFWFVLVLICLPRGAR